MEPAAHFDALTRDAGALLEAARGAMDRPVPACPDWVVADLVVHVGLVWQWAADVVEHGVRADRADAPEDTDEAALLAWAHARAAQLIDVLRTADPAANCWTFGEPRTASFWFRRQALETALHAWDVGAAAGRSVTIDPTLAADGVDELLHVMVPRLLRRDAGDWRGESVHLHRTDGDGEWLVRLGPDGAVDVARAHGKGDVALRAGAATLWLWASNRASLDALGVEVFGDPSIAERWTAAIAI